MRTAMLVIVVLLLVVVPPARASIVIHDGTPGIVACMDCCVLDSDGQVWSFNTEYCVWAQAQDSNPPMPVDLIKLWELSYLITMDNVLWRRNPSGPGWQECGSWPTSDVPEGLPEADLPSKTIPNPSSGQCQIAFGVQVEGPILVQVFDATGRIIRNLLDGPHPAGEYSLKWDGRDDAGRELPAGMYFTQVTTGQGTATGRVVLAR